MCLVACLFVVFCLLPAVWSLWFVVCVSLLCVVVCCFVCFCLPVDCLMFDRCVSAVRCSLFVVCCLFFVVRCLLCVVRCCLRCVGRGCYLLCFVFVSVFVVRCVFSLCAVGCSLFVVRCALCVVCNVLLFGD